MVSSRRMAGSGSRDKRGMTAPLIHIATITQAHSLAGQFKLHCLLDSPDTLKTFAQFYDAKGEPLALTVHSTKGKQPIASLEGVADRNGAEALKQKKIFAQKTDFPANLDGEYYSHELAGLELRKPDGTVIGNVLAHHNFGAGDILEVQFNNGKAEMMPFVDAVFPELNVDEGYVSFVPPEWLE